MQRRYNLRHFILAGVVVLVLTPLMVVVDAQARIVFASDRDGNREIYVMDIDGKNSRNLTNNRHADRSPSWSPDGKRIVFTSQRDGNWEIYVMDADGSNPRRLTENPKNDQFPSWSSDGERIAFMSDRDGADLHFDIYVMDADGGNPQNLTNNPFDERYPSWSPDGERIAFSARREGNFENKFGITYEIYVMDDDGGNLQRLTNNLTEDQYPAWSPDGKRIAFSARRDGHFENQLGITYEIYVMDADGQNEQRLTENQQNDWFPSWSPDGERVAFAADRKGDFANFEIYVIDNDGGNQRRLTENRVDDWSPSWSPDGERIAFMSELDGNPEIYVMDNDGGNQQNLTNNPHDDWSPSWFNSPFSVSPAGKRFMIWGRLKRVDR